jgi:hypothetical protein
MKIKIIIQLLTMNDADQSSLSIRHAEVFNGELDIAPKGEYLTKISLIAEGHPHPICDVPFSPTVGYWEWHPPMTDDSGEMESREIRMMVNAQEEKAEGTMHEKS